VVDFARRVVGQFKMFPIKKEALRLKGVKNLKMSISNDDKTEFVSSMHTKLEKAMCMVFVNRKDSAAKLQNRLKSNGIEANILMGGMEAADRDRMIDNFRQGVFTTLISTNVLARGIDVPEVDIVINYDVPMIKQCGFYNPDYANFMHRVGRTGRFGTDGLALTLVSQETEHEHEHMELIASHYDIEIASISSFDELQKIYSEMRQDTNLI
jgi:ATP-dependent RNA helicase DDX19/DBP5